jgi:hypothetical protein
MNIIIEKLPHPERHGDWHDPLIKWAVRGPGAEVQKFSTLKEANSYSVCRRHAASQSEAIHCYLIHG